MINTLFYFAASEAEYQAHRQEVGANTIVFCKAENTIWKGGLRYGGDGTVVHIDPNTSSISYAINDSSTEHPTNESDWLSERPEAQQGRYLWTRDITAYTDGTYTITYGVVYFPLDGAGTVIDKNNTFVRYSNQKTLQRPDAESFTLQEPPSLEIGDWLWVLNRVTYEGETPLDSYSVSRVGSDGAQGDPGLDGYTTHFAYATSSDGKTNFSTTNFSGATYIGTCRDNNENDPTTPESYVWTKWKGDDGQDGLSSYTHIKYSNDAGAHFTDDDGDAPGYYMGQCVDNNISAPTDVTLYTWALIKGLDGDDPIDPTPTKDSPNAVSSGGVYDVTHGTLKTRYIPFDLRSESIIFLSDEDMTELFGPATMVGGQSMFDLTVGQYQHIYRVTNSKSEVFEIAAAYSNANGARKIVGINGNLTIELSFTITNGVYVNAVIAKRETSIPGISYEEAQNLNDSQKVIAQNNMMGKAYAPAQNSGLGKVYLDKNNGVLTQSMINVANTVYVIQYDYTMSGNITVPAGCILQFDGGSISGSDSYSLTGNNTDIQASPSAKIFSGVDIQGTWVVTDIYLTWMNIPNYNDCRDEVHSIMRLQNDNVYQNIYLPNREICYTPSYDNVAENRYFFILSSNTHLHVINKIKVNGNDATHYHAIHAYNKSNVTVDGGGSVIGDVGSHLYISGSSSEWGYGVSFINVKYGIIKDLTITHCTGDGINIDGIDTTVEEGSVEKASEYITIDNVSCLYNRRDGMSLEFCANVSVYNSTFAHTGKVEYTPGGCGVDIEPYRNWHCTKNILFDNCKFYDNEMQSLKIDSRASYVIDNITIKNCKIDEEILANKDSDGYLPVAINVGALYLISKDTANLKNVCIKNSFVRTIANSSYGNNDIVIKDSDVGGITHYYTEGTVKYSDMYFYNCKLHCGKIVSTNGIMKSPVWFKAYCNWYFYDCDINFNEFKDYDGEASLNIDFRVFTYFYNCKSKSILGTKIDVVNSTYPSSFGYIARGVKTSIINSVFTDTDAFLIQAPVQYPNSEDETIDLTIINTKLVGTGHHPWSRADYIFDFGPAEHNITHLNGNIVIDGLSSATVKRTKVCADTILSNTVGTKKIDSNTPWFDGTKPVWWNGTDWVDANGTIVQ